MISSRNLAVTAAAVGPVGKESTIFRKVIGWSVVRLAVFAVLVYLRSTSVLGWTVR